LGGADVGQARIGRISTSGTVTESPTRSFGYKGITTGPDGNNIWMSDLDANAIARVRLP
jgi:streptogramin lyase